VSNEWTCIAQLGVWEWCESDLAVLADDLQARDALDLHRGQRELPRVVFERDRGPRHVRQISLEAASVAIARDEYNLLAPHPEKP